MRLPRPPGVIRRAFAAHPRGVDIAIVVTFLFGCGFMTMLDLANTFGEGLPAHLDGPIVIVTLLRIAVVATALYFRRRYPLAGLSVVALAQFGDQGMQSLATAVALFFMLYAVPVFRSVSAGWVGYGIALIASATSTIVLPAVAQGTFLSGPVSSPLSWAGAITALAMNAIWLLAILMLGINLGNRRRYLEAIIGRAHQLVRERDQLAQLAVAEERSRIAREMHDIVAHSVSVMIALSEGASRAMTAAPEAAADAMQRSAETGRTALAEMRRLLGALQNPGEDEAELAPQPGTNDIPELVQSFRDAGLNVDFELAGGDLGDRGQELAVYRVVQEALTNVLRYAGATATAKVVVRGSHEGTVVEVRDQGRAPGTSGPTSGLGSGRGLAGLAERVRVFGGEIESGRAEDGPGWNVRATFPVHSAARGPGAAWGGAGSAQKIGIEEVREAETNE